MMGSEYSSSGCESGWTMYLEHSMNPSSSLLKDPAAAFLVDQDNGNHHISNNQRWRRRTDHDMEQQQPPEEEEEDNLSMLSDASSPNLHDHQHDMSTVELDDKSTQPHHHHHNQNYNSYESHHFLDDTAPSSHLIMDFSPNNYNGYFPTNNTTPTTPTHSFLHYPSHGFFQTDFYQFQGSSAFQHQLGFGITQPPTPSSQQLHTHHQWFGGIRSLDR